MSIEAERLVHADAPTQEQLQRLASIGIRSAVDRGRFKSIQRKRQAHYFIDELDLLADGVVEEDTPTQIRHRMAVRIGVRPPQENLPKTWSLKYFDTYFVEAQPGEWKGERSVYQFEWTRSRILMANRTLRLVGFEAPYDQDDLEAQLDHFKIRDDDAAILRVSEELRTVTEDDCEELIKDMTDYFTVVDSVSR